MKAIGLSAAVSLLCSVAWAQQPVIVSVEGDWSAEAVAAGYDYLSFEGQPDYEAILAALRDRGVTEGRAMLVGGTANLVRLSALDRQADRAFGLVVAAAEPDHEPGVESGDFGWNAFSGTYWSLPSDSEWLTRFGAVVERIPEDKDPRRFGLDRFAALLELRRVALPSGTKWQVRRDPDFEIRPGSIPNAGLIAGEVWVTVSGQRIWRNGSLERLDLSPAFAGTGYVPTEVVPRDGPVWFVLGMTPPGTVPRAAVFRVIPPRPAEQVFEGPEEDGRFPGVPDILEVGDGRLRLFYVARNATPQNTRTAISGDGGRTFTQEFRNPFGDAAIPNPRGTDINVDPAALHLNDGGFLGIAMRGARLYVFNSIDGKTFVPSGQPAIEPEELLPGATGLFDPTLVQTPDGRVWMYVTAGTGPAEADSRVVRAELSPVR